MHRRLSYLVLLILAMVSLALPANAMVVPVYGYVHCNLVLVTDHQIIWFYKCSGSKPGQLISLDKKTGVEQWRRSLGDSARAGCDDGSGSFFFMNGNELTKARLSSGAIIWQKNLFSIPGQKFTPPVSLVDELKSKAQQVAGSSRQPLLIKIPTPLSFGPPNRIHYSKLMISGASIVVGRSAMQSSGCIVTTCFEDWLLLSQNKGDLLDGGPGTCLAGKTNLFFYDREFTFEISNGKKIYAKNLHDSLSQTCGDLLTFPKHLKYNDSDDVLIYADTHTASTTAWLGKLRGAKFQPLNLKKRSSYQQGWVILADKIIRYSECSSVSFDGPNPPAPFWLEVYDLEGNLVKERTFPDIKDFFTHVVGVNANGNVILQTGSELLKITPRSLEMTKYQVKDNANLLLTKYKDGLVSIRGDQTYYAPMQSAERREITVTFQDAENFIPKWEFREKVTVEKLP